MDNKKIEFCFVGHVDAGKSTCAGQLMMLTNQFTTHEKEKILSTDNKRQIFSNIFDIYEEERERGKTREFSDIEFEYEDYKYHLIDTPGHKAFLRSMVNGVSNLNTNNIIGCLVISLSKGEFESGWDKGQTKEDLIIIRSLGIRKIIVLYNKLDTILWNEEVYKKTVDKVEKFVKFCDFTYVEHIPISAYDGIGLINNEKYPDWCKNKCLLDTLKLLKNKEEIVSPTMEVKGTEEENIFINKTGCEINKIVANIKILNCKNLISSGFEGIIHFQGQDTEFTIDRILGKNKFLIKSKSSDCIISFKTALTVKYTLNNFLIRSGDVTIGFGKIIKFK